MTTFKMACVLCKQIVTGDPLRHLAEAHNPMEFFSLVPVVSWADLGVKLEPKEEKKA